MNLYLIQDPAEDQSDAFEHAVVAAQSEDEARLIHPDGRYKWDSQARRWMGTFNDTQVEDCHSWINPESVAVELIGTSINDTSTVVCASFRYGE
jgi:hypothetical protein